MKPKNSAFLAFFLFCAFPFLVNAATYSYYFSNSGHDSAGDGAEGSPWATLSKVDSAVNALASTDVVNLYFDRGDTWKVNTARVSKSRYGLTIGSTDPAVNIDAYGTGEDPIFDGLVTNFSAVPDHDATKGPLKWNSMFTFRRDNCSVKNVEITGVYGNGITVGGSYFTLSNSLIKEFGSSAVTVDYVDTNDITVSYNTIHTGQQLMKYGKVSGWGAALTMAKRGYEQHKDNWIHHNTIYDISGEGIIVSNSLTEYNIVGDTCSTGIHAGTHAYDALEATTRYNFVTFSDWSTSEYLHCGWNVGGGALDGSPVGIRIFDDQVGGDNSGADFKVYGNIMINRHTGFRFFQPWDTDNPFGNVEIYGNIAIDSKNYNYSLYQAYEATAGTFHGNSSILIDRPSSVHVVDDKSFPDAGWTIHDNHFWTDGEYPAVDLDWQRKYKISDPLLMRRELINLIKLGGVEYYRNINPAVHLNPPVNSPIYGITPLLSMEIEDIIGLTLLPGDNQPRIPDGFLMTTN